MENTMRTTIIYRESGKVKGILSEKAETRLDWYRLL